MGTNRKRASQKDRNGNGNHPKENEPEGQEWE